jgi:acyl-CoA synthetase (AMP-forming)/AMP-acid ligase II
VELTGILDYVAPCILFMDPDYASLIGGLRNELSYIELFIGLSGSYFPDVKKYEWLIEEGEPIEPEVKVTEEDISAIFFTSGTTGRPKGAMRNHRQEFINALANAVEVKAHYDERALLLFPFYHIPFVDSVVRCVLMANTIVIRREGRFDAQEVLDLISREKITMCQFVPTMINVLVQEENIQTYDLSHFRLLIYVGSPIPVAVLKKAMERFSCRFMQFYGQTESGPAAIALRPEDHVLEGPDSQMERLASAGRPFLGCDVRVVDEKDKDVSAGEVGEVILRGDTIMVGYWNLPEVSAITLKNGWLHTGDMGRFDEGGYVYIVERKHDMIISGGKNIYPREVEEMLYRHGAILEASVIGVPDEFWGESVKAIIVVKEGMAATEEEIFSFCKENLASYKKPRSVEFRKELPKNPTGKILKKLIKEEYWKNSERKV